MSEETKTLTTRVKALLDETKRLNERFEKQISFLETLPQIFKQNSLYTKDYEQGLERPHETWANVEKNFLCYNKNENQKYPHIYHTIISGGSTLCLVSQSRGSKPVTQTWERPSLSFSGF